MAFVSVTRLHLASMWSFPSFLVYTLASSRQARGSPGFVAGWLSSDGERGFWTCTVWDSAAAMRAFRNSGIHMKAMPRLLRWCDEAAYAHWEQDGLDPPSETAAYRRMAEAGKLSKVNAPSVHQAAGRMVGRAAPPTGRRLKPRC